MKRILLITTTLIYGFAISCFAQYTKLYDFNISPDGGGPYCDLVLNGGYLYGMTLSGGTSTNCMNGCGIIFKIKPDGTGYLKLLDFDGSTYGSKPYGSLLCDGTWLYAMTANGGSSGYGTAFRIRTNGTGYQRLYDFDGSANGSVPFGSFYSDGTYLYGMTSGAGAYNGGTIFKIKPDGSGYAKLRDLSVDTTGSFPGGTFVSDGTYLYAMATDGGANSAGTIFKIKPDGTGFAKLIDLQDTATGREPYGSLIYNGGYLYGMTYDGGSMVGGTVFKIKSDGTGFSKLFNFNKAVTGGGPSGSLVLVDTFLYGMTYDGGSTNMGVLFRIKADGSSFLKIMEFTGTTNGRGPLGSLIYDGVFLYGMTANGGVYSRGTIFKMGTAIGIDEISRGDATTIYPNPFTAAVIVRCRSGSTITFFDYTGKEILSTRANGETTIINTEAIAAGMYFVRVESGRGVVNYKIVKDQ